MNELNLSNINFKCIVIFQHPNVILIFLYDMKNNFSYRLSVKAIIGSIPVLTGIMMCSCSMQHADQEKPNILFIVVDDLRPDLGCYGNTIIKTPHIDNLAKRSVTFTKAFCQVGVCAPSRASMMTGLRPDSTRVWHLEDKFRKTIPDVLTIPQYLHKDGYYTVSMGKIFHNHMPDSISFDEPDLRPEAYKTKDMIGRDAESFYYDEGLRKELDSVREERIKKNPKVYAGGWAYGRAVECSDAPDSAFYDGAQTILAIETLKRLKNGEKPFFLALGLFRPHLPFVAPKKYWDMYNRDSIPMARNDYLPVNSPVMAVNPSSELKGCYDLEYVKHPSVFKLSADSARMLKHGYYACVSYVDACIGLLMKNMEELDLLRNTIVVITGDNGWKLGEHRAWGKHTNYMNDTRIPMIVYAPGMKSNGKQCSQLTEHVDLFPTLCQLAGITIPKYLQGSSLVPLLNDTEAKWKSAVFTQFHRKPNETPDGKRYMGYSMITNNYHYIEWRYWDYEHKTAGSIAATELYNLVSDEEENMNISSMPENRELVNDLSNRLNKGWRYALHP